MPEHKAETAFVSSNTHLSSHTPLDLEERYQALRENEERLRLAIAAADIGTWHWDIPSDALTCSPQAKSLLGLAADVPTTFHRFLAAVHADDRPAVNQALERTLAERRDYNVEFRAVWPNGDTHWIATRGRAYGETEGRPIRVEGIVANIDARKAAEAALEAVLEREHRIAETLQRSLLLMPAEDAFRGLSVSTLYEAAMDDMEVGGDFMDAFALVEERVALVVGDVSGKGLEAAARTADVKYVLRAFLRETPEPETALTRLNAHLCYTQAFEEPDASGVFGVPSAWELPFEGFVCLAVIVVNTATGEIAAASAGAELPLIIRASGKVEEIPVYGTPLAVTPNASYAGYRAQILAGDLVVMMTDGITEARCKGEFFGPEGLVQAVAQEEPDAPLRRIAQTVFEQARSFSGAKLRDDACLLLARRRGVTPSANQSGKVPGG